MKVSRLKTTTALALSLLLLVIIAQNTAPVETRVLLWSFAMPRALLLAVTLALGIALGLLWSVRLAGHRNRSD